MTARYGGVVMWIAGLSILFQVAYNLAVMRYAQNRGPGRVRKKPRSLRLIHPIGRDYYATLRAKLHWGKGL